MEHVNIITAFVAGVLMFLAPCTLPLIPGFIAYISANEKEKAMRKALLFCLGFLLTFLVFGILAGLLGYFLAPYKIFIQKLGALFIIFFGLYILGIFKLSLFNGSRVTEYFHRLQKTRFSPFIFGVSFAAGWSPCVGPVLAGIFFYATFAFSVFQALWLFLFFALGFIVPFLLVAYLVQRSRVEVRIRSYRIFNTLAGAVLIFVGALLFTDNFSLISVWAYDILKFINYERLNNLL